MDITVLYDALSEFGVNTDHYPLAIALEGDANPQAWILTGEPHPYNEPHFTLWHGYVGPRATVKVAQVAVFDDVRLARADFNSRTESLA